MTLTQANPACTNIQLLELLAGIFHDRRSSAELTHSSAADYQGDEVHAQRGLVVLWRPPLRDADRAVAVQRLRRGRVVLVDLQRAGLLPPLPLQGGQAAAASGELATCNSC